MVRCNSAAAHELKLHFRVNLSSLPPTVHLVSVPFIAATSTMKNYIFKEVTRKINSK